MSVLHHDNIVELLAVSTEEEPYGMIFEFMANGDLNQYLRTRGPYAVEGQESNKGYHYYYYYLIIVIYFSLSSSFFPLFQCFFHYHRPNASLITTLLCFILCVLTYGVQLIYRKISLWDGHGCPTLHNSAT